MFFDNNSMKVRAKSLIRGVSPSPMVAGLILVGISWVAAILAFFIWPVSVVLTIVCAMVSVGFEWYCLEIAREDNPAIGEIFSIFSGRFFTVLLAVLLKAILISIGFFLFYVPGIILFYCLRPLSFIIKDNPDMSVFSAMKASMSLMKGHKLELFKVDLSLIGWHILNLFTGTIAGIYVYPYTNILYAEFYDYLKGQASLLSGE